MVLPACRSAKTRFDLVEYADSAEARTFYQEFAECYYRVQENGRREVIARHRPADPVADPDGAVQIIHIRELYDPKPSVAPSHPTMTNALVTYVIYDRRSLTQYGGGGFVRWSSNPGASAIPGVQNHLKGELERATLTLLNPADDAHALFIRPVLTGDIVARRDDRRATAMINELRHRFGPLPDTPPPMTDPSLR